MSPSEAFQQTLAELSDINRQIYLHIPTTDRVVQQQIHWLSLAQDQLDPMIEKVFLLFGRGGSPANFWFYRTLTTLIQTMHQTAQTLQLIAEEYRLDPEGAIACLQDMGNQHVDIRQHISDLKTVGSNQRAIVRCYQERLQA